MSTDAALSLSQQQAFTAAFFFAGISADRQGPSTRLLSGDGTRHLFTTGAMSDGPMLTAINVGLEDEFIVPPISDIYSYRESEHMRQARLSRPVSTDYDEDGIDD